MSEMLKVKNLNKSFGEYKILSNINFEIQKGDIVGLIGKNGSGKTTLMKMILGFTPLSSGDISFKENSYYRQEEFLSKIGFLLDCKLFEDFSAYDNLKLFSKYSKHQIKNLDEHISELLQFVGLDNTKKQVKTFSFGMKQRLGLALALLNDPDFLILDEPFVGLDPIGVKLLLDYIVKLRSEKGVTILISSHQLHEIEEICDYFFLIHNNCIEWHSSIDKSKIVITIEKMSQELRNRLADLVDIRNTEIEIPNNMTLLNTVLKIIYEMNGNIRKLNVINSLQDLFEEE
ncbi:ABC transporter ATP-binding protein [Streptococcus merionis]|uniref:Multidrug ABC transporter ATPase n=1 Tax=Streptococcus merionis TaxID=400065 RepID=A0A239T054_9STRE|nr:ABC transporter ATP-binding protein [Streptococcus merionis]SNU91111.1 multidrug ABC transporter ATPase [Streptococcus merionis]